MGSSFCIGNGVGIEALAEPIFVRGVSPSMAGTPRAWLAHLAPSSSKMDSLAWLRYAGAGHANRRGGKSPAAIGKANAPTPKTSDSKFDSLRGKMLPHFILPESLIL